MKHRNVLTNRHPIPFIGGFRQLLGGAMSWLTIATFVFSGMAAWNTPTMDAVRGVLPWLNIGVFITIIVMAICFAMWLEHKWFQPSIMSYWGHLFWEEAHSKAFIERQERIEGMLKVLLNHDETGK